MAKQTKPAKTTKTQTAKTQTAGGTKELNFDDIKSRADSIVTALDASVSEMEKYEKIYLIEPDSSTGQSTRQNAKYLYDGHGHAVIDAIVRTWCANPIKISVPTPDPALEGLTAKEVQARKQAREAAEKAEKFLRALHYRSDEVTQRNITKTILKEIALFGEASAIIDNVLADEAKPECPFIFDAPHPKLCFPRYSRRKGLLQHVFKTQVTLADVKATYGDKAAFLTGNDEDLVTLVDYIDRDVHVVWIDEQDDQPILNLAHKLDFIPRVSMICGSQDFFEKEEQKRQPFLYTYLKSGVWSARNLHLTLMNTNVVQYLNAAVVSKTVNARGIGMDFSQPFGEIKLDLTESVEQFAKNLIPPEQLRFYGELTLAAEEYTMPKTAMGAGEAIGNAPAAAIAALTAQALVATKDVVETTEKILSKMHSIVLQWIIARGDEVSVWGQGGQLESIAPSDLTIDGTQYTHVDVTLEEDRQQLRQMVAGLATTLWNARLAGFETVGEILEEGGVIKSAQDWKRDVYERAMIEANLPTVAKQAAEQAQTAIGVVNAVPAAPAANAPPGTMPGNPPSNEQLLGALQAGGGMPGQEGQPA